MTLVPYLLNAPVIHTWDTWIFSTMLVFFVRIFCLILCVPQFDEYYGLSLFQHFCKRGSLKNVFLQNKTQFRCWFLKTSWRLAIQLGDDKSHLFSSFCWSSCSIARPPSCSLGKPSIPRARPFSCCYYNSDYTPVWIIRYFLHCQDFFLFLPSLPFSFPELRQVSPLLLFI